MGFVDSGQDKCDGEKSYLSDLLALYVELLDNDVGRVSHLDDKTYVCSVDLVRGGCQSGQAEAVAFLHRVRIRHIIDLKND